MSVTLRVRGLAYGGSFVGDVTDGPPESIGKRAFIPFVAPGELVRGEIVKEEKRFLIAEAGEIIEQSKDRIKPPCPYFTHCGGCDLQHLPIARQRVLKREMIETTIKAHAGMAPKNGVLDLSAGLPDYGYRRRITLHLSGNGDLGFYRAGTGDVIDIERCLISSAEINGTLTVLREHAAALKTEIAGIILDQGSNNSVSLVLLPRDKQISKENIQLLRRVFPTQTVRANTTAISDEAEQATGHFSQINARGNEIILAAVLEWISHDAVTELYAGAGNFSIPLAEKGKRVTAVEVDPALTALGEKIAKSRNLTPHLQFVTESCERYLKKNTPENSVVLDPPRAGAKEIMQRMNPDRTKEIIYISCNLPSLARDLKLLAAQGYELIETRFVDMFPQTHHVETVSLLRAC